MRLLKRYQSLVFFDTETTGLCPEEDDRIIELAMLRVNRDGSQKEYDQFVKLPSGRSIPPEITEKTNITDEMLVNGVEEQDAALAFAEMLQGEKVIVLAHNCQFDLRFVREMLRRQVGEERTDEILRAVDWLDTLTVLRDRKHFPHKLESAISYYHLENQVVNSHRAIDDVKALAAVTDKMERERSDLPEYANVFGYSVKYGMEGEPLDKISYFPQEFVKTRVNREDILPLRGPREREKETPTTAERREFRIDYEKELNPQQLEAVKAIDGPVLVLAGAGSGKTRTLIYRMCRMLEEGILPESILLLTFTNKAALEMQNRAKEMLGEQADRILACTYHSFCTKMLRKYCYPAGLMRDFTVLSGDDPAVICNMMTAELGFDKISGFPTGKAIENANSSATNKGISLQTEIRRNQKLADFSNQITQVVKMADEYKRKNDLLSYDDLMVRFLELLIKKPEIAEEIDNQYKYICIDEYQDSNPIQAEIISRIRKVNNNLMVVGDDMQSIYKFRGSDVRLIRSFPQSYPGAKVIALTQNYRSTPEILNFANRVVDTNLTNNQFKKTLFTKNPSGNPPVSVHTKNQESAASLVANNIATAHSKGVPYSSILILARGSASFGPMEIALNAKGINYEKRGGLKFMDRAHVRDVMAFLRVFTNPKDELSWFRIVKTVRGIGDATAREISSSLRVEGVSGLLNYAGKRYESGLAALHDFLESLNGSATVAELVERVSNYHTKIQEQSGEDRDAIKRHKDDFQALINLAKNYESPVDYLDSLSIDTTVNDERDEKNEDRVILSTVHSAKGLEYDTVYVLDSVDGAFPFTSADSVGTPEDQEELRCFYVAITRAKRLLYILIPQFCATKYGNRKKNPSHFLNKVQGTAIEIKK